MPLKDELRYMDPTALAAELGEHPILSLGDIRMEYLALMALGQRIIETQATRDRRTLGAVGRTLDQFVTALVNYAEKHG